jgi:hypothetical protein
LFYGEQGFLRAGLFFLKQLFTWAGSGVKSIPPCFERWICFEASLKRGRLAQLVERLVYTENVGSSSLSSPTILCCAENGFFMFPQAPGGCIRNLGYLA